MVFGFARWEKFKKFLLNNTSGLGLTEEELNHILTNVQVYKIKNLSDLFGHVQLNLEWSPARVSGLKPPRYPEDLLALAKSAIGKLHNREFINKAREQGFYA